MTSKFPTLGFQIAIKDMIEMYLTIKKPYDDGFKQDSATGISDFGVIT